MIVLRVEGFRHFLGGGSTGLELMRGRFLGSCVAVLDVTMCELSQSCLELELSGILFELRLAYGIRPGRKSRKTPTMFAVNKLPLKTIC